MSREIPLALQTTYAELLDQAATAAFHDDFGEKGNFVSKVIREKKYWYFEQKTNEGWKQKYVGPETPELLDKISNYKAGKSEIRHRAALVSALLRSTQIPKVTPEVGRAIASLAEAGVFRLRGVLIGTIAYQTYAAMLGVRLPLAALRTGDIDVAQSADISIAVKDRTPPMLDVLRQADRTFREIPHIHDSRRATTYKALSGVRVDFLTPNRGKDTDEPKMLPALGTDAEPLRFLDFLIRDPEPAVILHDTGIFVLVPSPQRYALHKLIVARRRQLGSAKIKKDIQQAEILLGLLIERRPSHLREAWKEAFGRGPTWRQLLGEGLGHLHVAIRDPFLGRVGAPRSVIPELDLNFTRGPARYDDRRDVVAFVAGAKSPWGIQALVRCAVSREALDDHFRADGLGREGRLEAFRKNRALFEAMARIKYLKWPVEEPSQVLIGTSDVPELLKEVSKAPRRKKSKALASGTPIKR